MALSDLYTKDSLRTFTGKFVNLLDPDPLTIIPFDIAVGLARQCRFGGHTKKFYSVADHSVWCMNKGVELYPQDEKLHFALLMHDAHEYLLGDIPTPLKRIIPAYEPHARKLQNIINQRFGVTETIARNSLVYAIDKMALEWEWHHKVENFNGIEWDAKTSADIFIHYFQKLCKVPHVLQ